MQIECVILFIMLAYPGSVYKMGTASRKGQSTRVVDLQQSTDLWLRNTDVA
jgi:hypothetical protein